MSLGDLPPIGSWPPILNFIWITFEKENGYVWKPDTISKNGPQCTVGEFGGHIDIVTSFNQLYAFMGLYPMLFGIVWLSCAIYRAKKQKLTFEPFEPQKR